MLYFDRRQVRRNRSRHAPKMAEHAFLFDWATKNLATRLSVVRRDFPLMLQIGARAGAECDTLLQTVAKAQQSIKIDLSDRLLADHAGLRVAADEEFLPFAPASFDLAVSALALHTANDLPGALIQIRRALKPDGLFIAALPGGESLHELRSCLIDAELSLKGGVHPRVAPFADKQQMGALMQRAGFALPVVDSEKITVTYADPLRLMADLRGMGESSAVAARPRSFTSRAVLMEAARLYKERFSEPDGRIAATFEIIFAIGWAPHASQQKPLRPGSAERSLAEALGTHEIGTGEKATP